MAAGDGGSIINVSSVASIRPTPTDLPYAAAKAGLDALTAGLALAYGPKVRVNAIMAGPFLTDIARAWDMEAFNQTAQTYPLKRAGQPEEVVGAALYLASDMSSFTTGSSRRRRHGRCPVVTPAENDLGSYRAAARVWLGITALRRRSESDAGDAGGWGVGSDDVSVFHDLTAEEERAHLESLMRWQQAKFDAGFGAITWPAEYGGVGLSAGHEQAFLEEEARFETPALHETASVTVRLMAPTVRIHGTPDQRERFVRRFLRADELCCQVFSEPGAGSDLAGVTTRAVCDGDEWVVDGQKVWSSGAQFSSWGLLIARTDPDVPKHAGIDGLPRAHGFTRHRDSAHSADVGRLVVQRGLPHRRAVA